MRDWAPSSWAELPLLPSNEAACSSSGRTHIAGCDADIAIPIQLARADFLLGNALEIRSIEVKAFDALLRLQAPAGEALEDATWNKNLALVVAEPDIELDRLLAVVPPRIFREDEHDADHTTVFAQRSQS